MTRIVSLSYAFKTWKSDLTRLIIYSREVFGLSTQEIIFADAVDIHGVNLLIKKFLIKLLS